MDRVELERLLSPADALIVVPPFCQVDMPSLAAHVLQACARRQGITVGVLYANMLFSRVVSWRLQIAGPGAPLPFFGERLFARSAYGVAPYGQGDPTRAIDGQLPGATSPDLYDLEARAAEWVRELGGLVAASKRFPVVGFTTTFEQTAASIAIANAVKQADPAIITVIGGANCDGGMADGISRLAPAIDYVFRGESEETFVSFLASLARGQRPDERIVSGTPCRDLTTIPIPDYGDYVRQREAWLTGADAVADEDVWLPYESSRGCWWGERHHCTFCGLNALAMTHREKPAELVLSELRALVERHPFRRVMMTDTIMPHGFFKTLIPLLADAGLDCTLFYELKSNLTLRQVSALERAGVRWMQPGIEALSSDLLRLMDKGVTARQNIALLRYARTVGVSPTWNLLFDFPGDRLEWYVQTLSLLPLLRHLHPPGGLLRLRIDRFSPYFERPEAYGVTRLRPLADYAEFLPPGVDPASVAYYFAADYASEWRERDGATTILPRLVEEVATWHDMWSRATPPELSLTRFGPRYWLRDTRGLADRPTDEIIEPEDAARLLKPRRMDDSGDTRNALTRRLAVALDGYYVPLVTADPDVLSAAELDGDGDSPPRSTKVVWHPTYARGANEGGAGQSRIGGTREKN